ncbi:MAG: MFS transporter [Lachnospiraceae bacterium]|nr:MFS transporter [Lachnospiraceae bacterium]
MKAENQVKTVRPFGMRDKLGYLFGDFGNDFTFILSTMILSKFYTDVMGVSAAVIGTIMMLARFVDAFTDVAMGRICDRSKLTANGKFKPWILRMCVPVAVASFLMYQSGLAHLPLGLKITYLAITYILWGSFCYTGINIPYGSMASAVSSEPGDRQSLSTFRTMGGMLAGMVIGILLPLIAYEKITLADGTIKETLIGSRVTLAAGIFSVLAIVCYLLCYKLITERVVVESATKDNAPSVGQMLRSAFTNRALISIIAASVVMLLAQLTMQNMAAYIYPDYYNSAAAQSASTMLMMVGMIAAAIFAKPLAAKFGKAEVSVVSNVFAAGVMIIIWVIRPENVWVYCGLQMLCWLGLGVFSMVSWALITDVIDYSELKNGIREDGSVYAMYSFARKLGQALAAGLSGWLLTAIGYNSEAAAAGQVQTPEVLSGIFNISTLIPAVGFGLLAAVLWFWYPLHKKQVDANVAALKEKHEKE